MTVIELINELKKIPNQEAKVLTLSGIVDEKKICNFATGVTTYNANEPYVVIITKCGVVYCNG